MTAIIIETGDNTGPCGEHFKEAFIYLTWLIKFHDSLIECSSSGAKMKNIYRISETISVAMKHEVFSRLYLGIV